MKGTDENIGSNTYRISEHVPIAIGYRWYSKDEVYNRSYFGPDCIDDYVRDLLEIETKHSIKINKAMIFTEEDKLYHDANVICHIGNKKTVLIKLEITVIKQVDVEVQHVIFVT